MPVTRSTLPNLDAKFRVRINGRMQEISDAAILQNPFPPGIYQGRTPFNKPITLVKAYQRISQLPATGDSTQASLLQRFSSGLEALKEYALSNPKNLQLKVNFSVWFITACPGVLWFYFVQAVLVSNYTDAEKRAMFAVLFEELDVDLAPIVSLFFPDHTEIFRLQALCGSKLQNLKMNGESLEDVLLKGYTTEDVQLLITHWRNGDNPNRNSNTDGNHVYKMIRERKTEAALQAIDELAKQQTNPIFDFARPQDTDGKTLLIMACITRNSAVVDKLCSLKDRINIGIDNKDASARTASMYAALFGDEKSFFALRAADAEQTIVDGMNRNSHTYLNLPAEIVRALLKLFGIEPDRDIHAERNWLEWKRNTFIYPVIDTASDEEFKRVLMSLSGVHGGSLRAVVSEAKTQNGALFDFYMQQVMPLMLASAEHGQPIDINAWLDGTAAIQSCTVLDTCLAGRQAILTRLDLESDAVPLPGFKLGR